MSNETITLHNKSLSTITTKVGEFKPDAYIEFPKDIAEKLLRLYPNEVIDLNAKIQAQAPQIIKAPNPPVVRNQAKGAKNPEGGKADGKEGKTETKPTGKEKEGDKEDKGAKNPEGEEGSKLPPEDATNPIAPKNPDNASKNPAPKK